MCRTSPRCMVCAYSCWCSGQSHYPMGSSIAWTFQSLSGWSAAPLRCQHLVFVSWQCLGSIYITHCSGKGCPHPLSICCFYISWTIVMNPPNIYRDNSYLKTLFPGLYWLLLQTPFPPCGACPVSVKGWARLPNPVMKLFRPIIFISLSSYGSLANLSGWHFNHPACIFLNWNFLSLKA